ncbi:STAS domain-containing protein [Streptomyces sp. NPDC005435]|uniref:STAS domain-containing protein n=1 Tax=Streptomyces sp. NPDC005435 TaxID=3154464 RepID=UPI003452ABFF
MTDSGHQLDDPGTSASPAVSYSRPEEGLWVIGLRGDVELHLMADVEAATHIALRHSQGPVLFDLRELRFCDSSLLNHLLRTTRRRRVALFGADRIMERLLEVTGAGTVLPLYADLDAARAALSLPPSPDRP